MLEFMVSDELCTRCDECVRDCPSQIIEAQGTGVPIITADNELKCMRCQHCLAVCPTGAVSILGKQPGDSTEFTREALPDLDTMELLVRARRSVRRFREKDVDPELIGRLLAATANAPTGANRRALTFSVVDDGETMKRLREQVMDGLRSALAAGAIPEQMAYLHMAVPAYFTHGTDLVFRGAPHLLLVSAGPEALCPHEDIAIALASFELLAVTAGLGAVWCGMLKMALETVPDLKALFGLPPDADYYAMLFGIPAVRHVRTVQRDDSAKVRRIG